MNDLDPLILVKDALKTTKNNQAALGRKVGIGRASVNQYVLENREYLPPLQAHRLLRLHPDIPLQNE